MNSNKPTEKDISAFLHDELSAEDRALFQERVKTDAAFQDVVSEFESLDARLRKIPKVQTSDLLTAKIMRHVQQHGGKKKMLTGKKAAYLAIAASVLLSCGLLWIAITLKANATSPVPATMIAKTDQTNSKASHATATTKYDALDWLKRAQSPNGAWEGDLWGTGNQYTVGLTGLSLLAFISADQYQQPEYVNTVHQAISFLTKNQNEDGSFGPALSNQLYNHGIATVALLKAKLNYEAPVSTEAIKKAVAFILSSQTAEGGWAYTNEKDSPNSSISIWQLHSLALAKQIGILSSEEPIQRSIQWLQKLSDDQGVIGYKSAQNYPFGQSSLVAISGVVWLYDDAQTANQENLIEFKIRFQNELENIVRMPEQHLNYYQFYFLTSALQKLKETRQFSLAKKVEEILTTKQIKAGDQLGSWDPNDYWGPAGGRVYSTAMATISLAALR